LWLFSFLHFIYKDSPSLFFSFSPISLSHYTRSLSLSSSVQKQNTIRSNKLLSFSACGWLSSFEYKPVVLSLSLSLLQAFFPNLCFKFKFQIQIPLKTSLVPSLFVHRISLALFFHLHSTFLTPSSVSPLHLRLGKKFFLSLFFTFLQINYHR
jgi:hypothetical protein